MEKDEHGDGSETITEIQNYLDTFNKEIGPAKGQTALPAGVAATSNNGTFYVDETGQYYIQQSDGTVRQVNGDASERNAVVTVVSDASEPVPEINNMEDGQADNQDILSTGNAYQTVTIVPSNGNADVSYLLIVQQPDENQSEDLTMDQENRDDQDLTVYDFTEGEEGAYVEHGEEVDDKSKIVKITPKKSQTVTQAHMCNYCNYTSPKRYLLSRHMKSHSEERPHKCSVCERGFKTLASLQNHVNTHTGTKPHKCKFCVAAFTTSGELVRHVRYRHTHEKPHRCTECDYSSVELSKLKRHMRCHTGERPYQCPHCTYASPDTFKLKRHLRIHTGEKPYECDICHARFTQSNSLKAHRLIHTGNKPIFKCELCPTTCGRKTDLRIHVQKLHTSDRPLKCKRCGKSFPDRYSYKIHAKSHEGEKCFRCDLCPYASVSQRHLESHMLIHTDQKPFRCEHCNQDSPSPQTFRQKQLLKRHQNLYHNPAYIPPTPKEKTHECPECGKAFRHKGNLIRHMAIHDPESANRERSIALKLGRQKRIQMLDGSSVELSNEVMSVQGQDGQQYVVLEVIQLEDGEGRQSVPLEDGDTDGAIENDGDITSIIHLGDGAMEAQLEDSSLDSIEESPNFSVEHIKKQKVGTTMELRKRIAKTQKDVQDCFGFTDDDEGMEEEGDLLNQVY